MVMGLFSSFNDYRPISEITVNETSAILEAMQAVRVAGDLSKPPHYEILFNYYHKYVYKEPSCMSCPGDRQLIKNYWYEWLHKKGLSI